MRLRYFWFECEDLGIYWVELVEIDLLLLRHQRQNCMVKFKKYLRKKQPPSTLEVPMELLNYLHIGKLLYILRNKFSDKISDPYF